MSESLNDSAEVELGDERLTEGPHEAEAMTEARLREALTFDEVTAENLTRCNRWHKGGIGDWSVSDWAVAMAGEAGEVCNAVKKLRRVEDEIANISDPERQLSTRAEAVAKIGEEIADTFLYLNLLACRLGLHLPTEVVAKFNATSERYGFPERLPAGAGAPAGRRHEAPRRVPLIIEQGVGRSSEALDALRRLSEAATPFASGGEWGRWKALLVEGARASGDAGPGLDAAQQITRWQVAVDSALALLAADTRGAP